MKKEVMLVVGFGVGFMVVVVVMEKEMEERKVVEMVVEKVEEVERVAGQEGTAVWFFVFAVR